MKKLRRMYLTARRVRANTQFRDLHSGRRCVIIGNGPSVRLDDLEALAGRYTTFCCNRFHMAYETTPFRPDYTVMIDPYMIGDFGNEIARLAKTPVFAGHADIDRVPAGCYFLPLRGETFKFSPDIRRFVSTGDSVIAAAVQIASFMGMKEIYLYGIDHSLHFEKQTAPGSGLVLGEGNHFIKGYRSGRPWCPPNVGNIEHALRACDDALRTQNGFLKNATRGGHLEVLERVDFDQLVVNYNAAV
ncbi:MULTISPECIES: 6-hydroxymethylpterin diphosphokinase MptE-like protein [unclassified Rhizobium]|uniref:6-hydroxymethylpterin diphosphokinase MptE-like protein n=1 Tax=unclassified Rhizobium TaxID=2613769 RepID=UPI00138F67A5|nr:MULTISPECIES: 6-hydroxymethylpterin diphosphokinase MptE-like protein [unclassified Rhizobium]